MGWQTSHGSGIIARMALWGGLSRQPEGREVLQLYVDADDVEQALRVGDGLCYQEFFGEELDLEIAGRWIQTAWLCVVPADPHPRRDEEVAAPPERKITLGEAFEVMRSFLAQFNLREPADRRVTIDQLLRWTSRTGERDGMPHDPAQWPDWEAAVERVLRGDTEP